jgi:histone demethylase JARID1
MEALEQLNSKPPGTIDLEKEQKRHEDWMRRGKKLFGKTNAPLHILHQHMKYVEERNESCLDLRDQPRMPVEPSSREHTPVDEEENPNGSQSNRDVFCLCRRPESGMMIECELCHEWYHGKCLKIARGKVKEDDKYTCPVCDWRLKIPRDATRPKLEDLENWQAEIPDLPFQPEEEDTLRNIIEHANNFRDHIRPYINPVMSNPEELTLQRFYLRKIEGAEILLAEETNFFRQELHRWAPVADRPPPTTEISLSTRKPRPTKQQKLMAQMGITVSECELIDDQMLTLVQDPMDLPENLRPKQPGWRKKGVMKKGESSRDKDSKTGNQSVESHTPPGLPHGLPFVNEVASGVTTTLPTREDRTSTFSYDAMATNDNTPLATTTNTTYERQHSPMFASASAHDFAKSMARSPSPTNVGVSTTGIDPQLEGMFGNPAISSVEKDNSVHVTSDDDTLRDTAGEALDIFNMTHDDERDEEPMFPGTGSDSSEHAFDRSHMFGDEWSVYEDDFSVEQ